MKVSDIAWIAGLVEGEGYIGCEKRSCTPIIKVCMTDEDVVKNLHRVSRVGHVIKGKPLPSGKIPWTWGVYRADQSVAILLMIYSFLGIRRRNAASTAILKWRTNTRIGSRRLRTFCIRGHSLIDENNLCRLKAFPNGRKCKICHRMRSRAFKLKKQSEAA